MTSTTSCGCFSPATCSNRQQVTFTSRRSQPITDHSEWDWTQPVGVRSACLTPCSCPLASDTVVTRGAVTAAHRMLTYGCWHAQVRRCWTHQRQPRKGWSMIVDITNVMTLYLKLSTDWQSESRLSWVHTREAPRKGVTPRQLETLYGQLWCKIISFKWTTN